MTVPETPQGPSALLEHPILEHTGSPVEGSALAQLASDPSSRSKFLKLVGGAAGAGAFSMLLAACGSSGSSSTGSSVMSSTGSSSAMANTSSAMSSTTDTSSAMTDTTAASGSGDLAIVNYALTLEYLEAQFYSDVASSGLFTGKSLDLIKAIGDQEQQHVAALTATAQKLGTPATKPNAKFPLDSAAAVLKLAATVENLGAAAYLGQAAKIQDPQILAAGIAIHSVEARHAATLNHLNGLSPTPDGAFGVPADMATVLAAVKPFLVA